MYLNPTGIDSTFGIIMLALFAFLVWALVDVWKSNANQDRKILWTLLVVLLQPIGGIIWFAAGRKNNR